LLTVSPAKPDFSKKSGFLAKLDVAFHPLELWIATWVKYQNLSSIATGLGYNLLQKNLADPMA
jgi:hypothetical protein